MVRSRGVVTILVLFAYPSAPASTQDADLVMLAAWDGDRTLNPTGRVRPVFRNFPAAARSFTGKRPRSPAKPRAIVLVAK
ncbi:MAG: hypothetical protein HC890_12315 [Chloroflexaceae bacterium]|nr:hypothetical protein [Chloroflexaceae bacterium]